MKLVLFANNKTGEIVMNKFALIFLFFLVFIAVATTSNAFSLKNVQFLEGEQDLLEKNEQIGKNEVAPESFLGNPEWPKNEVCPGFLLDKPEWQKNEIDPGIFLSNPEGPNNEIDPGIFLGNSERPKNEIDPGIE